MISLRDNEEGTLDDWAERGEYWQQQLLIDPNKTRGRKPRFLHRPLILTGNGVKLRVDHGTLLIRDGFTHYPQELKEYRFFPRDRRLPSRIIILDGNGGITFDTLEWLCTQGVPLIQLNWRGELINALGNAGYGADPTLVRTQIKLQSSPERIKFAKWLIERKIENSITTIKNVFPHAPVGTLNKLHEKLIALNRKTTSTTLDLLSIEGLAAQLYFRCWHASPLQWKGLGQRPIPNEWFKIGARQSAEDSNQFARHPINAILNYAYAMLQNQILTVVVAMGFDPTIGCLHSHHASDYHLIFDLMEPLRPIVDRAILNLAQNHVFSPHDFTLNKMGICRLHPQFARNIVKLIQNIPEIEPLTIAALNKMSEIHAPSVRLAEKNILIFKRKLKGRKKGN